MEAVLVFIDGTICDTRPRHHLGIGSTEFYERHAIMMDEAVPGSVECLNDLAREYEVVYIGARPGCTLASTEEWLALMGFPKGCVFLADGQDERLALVRRLSEDLDFAAGIGDRWDDNEMHLEIGCLSIILEEFAGNWDTVRRHLLPESAS